MNLLKCFRYRTTFFITISVLIITGCTFDGTALTTSGTDYEPHMVWDSTHFGVVYYHSAQSSGWPSIDVVKVNAEGGVVASRTGVGSIEHYYVPYYLSDLVWNANNQQFAFAYTKGKVIHFIRLDASLNTIGSPLVIQFPVDVDSYEHPTLQDMSLVWNSIRQEYGLTFVASQHPYLPDEHDDIYISIISPSGAFVGQNDKQNIVTCPGDCENTSLTFNTTSGLYAFSYFQNTSSTIQVMFSLLNPNGSVNTHEMMNGWNSGGLGEETRTIYDARTDEYVVVALKRKSGISGHELSYQLASSNGAPIGAHYPKSNGQGYDNLVDVANYMSPANNMYLICAEQDGQIHCWTADKTHHLNTDIVTTSSDDNSWGPSLAVSDETYLAWIKNGTLHFGVADHQ